ncbi:MAG: hypothetical protein RLN76_04160 [Phycisphaeraceae bacterium]
MLKPEDLYSEACQGLRHYSNCVMQIRTVTIAQGFIVLTAAWFMIDNQHYEACVGVAGLGLLLTLVLHTLHTNYGRHHQALLEYATQLERASPGGSGPWVTYIGPRERRFNGRFFKLIVFNGPVLLLMISLLGFIFAALTHLM